MNAPKNKVKRKPAINIQDVIPKATGLSYLNATFLELDRLNQVLETILPTTLKDACHIGAIDKNNSIVVLYVSAQPLFHIVRTYSDKILHEFKTNGFSFEKILIKVKI